MTAPVFRPYLVVVAGMGALVGFIVLLAVVPGVAFVVAGVTGVALTVVALRGAGPFFDWVAPDHPDALGSLDVERITPPTP
ncbi:hypothetical protein [Microbacterium sp. Leaf436]|uniref:hypothetical protein n=1 Tax=Microbacterium sp. Leaf436 TaxID=1736377 RepID=UPI0006F8A7C4|nr:hypothetical protein [Microbacterium sp. Leaf436]KQT75375.1 hypothetical protein ASG45_02425 [Microbacterium sp. Leaf436]